jgi:hypothetical protein
MKSDYKYLYNDKHTEVSDLALASAIQYLGFTVIALNRDPNEHPKVSFVFEKSDELNNAIHRYWEGLLLVEPKSFWNIARELKSRVRAN